ncbi:MAG: RNA methyltransferase [Candidatus Binataceae bacterium]
MMDHAGAFAFVLFKPRNAGNIGAAARALKNMGFSDLRIVASEAAGDTAAIRMAVHARDVLERARVFPDLPAALADRTLTVGATARTGPYRAAARPPRQLAAELAELAPPNRVAIVFGPEDFGLTNRELRFCQNLITIPAAPEYPSLNLAQALMVVAYEMRMAILAKTDEAAAQEAPMLAGADEVEAMLSRLADSLVKIGYLPEDNPRHIMFAIAEIFGRARLRPREADILNGIARQIGWFAERGRETIEAKRRAGKRVR